MAANPFSLESKTILVTGASSGIGRGIAIFCSRMGANVIINGRNINNFTKTISLMDVGNHKILVGDLTLSKERDIIVEKLPKIDGVVHCAGIGHRILCKYISEEDVDNVININFKAPVLLQTALLQKKKINKAASIVFITSIASDSPSYGNALYSASKGALISYANCLGIELAPRDIRVNCVSPAMVMTDLILKDGITDEQHYPLKRYGQPKDIAPLVVYLLSDTSSWMTGSNLKITGGAR